MKLKKFIFFLVATLVIRTQSSECIRVYWLEAANDPKERRIELTDYILKNRTQFLKYEIDVSENAKQSNAFIFHGKVNKLENSSSLNSASDEN